MTGARIARRNGRLIGIKCKKKSGDFLRGE
jgi:hypothetical protein